MRTENQEGNKICTQKEKKAKKTKQNPQSRETSSFTWFLKVKERVFFQSLMILNTGLKIENSSCQSLYKYSECLDDYGFITQKKFKH